MLADLGARVLNLVKGYDNMQLQMELRETHEQLSAKTRESLEFQMQLVALHTELLETRGRLLQASAENQSLQFKCQITEQEVCDLRQFKHSITAVTSGHAFWQSSRGS